MTSVQEKKIAVFGTNYMEHINTLSGHHAQFLIFNLEVCTLTTGLQNLNVVINCMVQTLL